MPTPKCPQCGESNVTRLGDQLAVCPFCCLAEIRKFVREQPTDKAIPEDRVRELSERLPKPFHAPFEGKAVAGLELEWEKSWRATLQQEHNTRYLLLLVSRLKEENLRRVRDAALREIDFLIRFSQELARRAGGKFDGFNRLDDFRYRYDLDYLGNYFKRYFVIPALIELYKKHSKSSRNVRLPGREYFAERVCCPLIPVGR